MKAKLKDVVCIITDKKSSSLIDVNNYVSTENILPNREGIRFPAKSLPRISKILSYQKNDVLVSNIRPYFKKIWFSDRDGVRSNDVLAFRTKNSKILLQKYLYLLLQSDTFFDYVNLTAKGTKMPRGDKKAILNFTFELPSINTQKKLTNYFFVIESLIKLNNLINDNLTNQIKYTSNNYFQFFKNHSCKNWTYVKLEDIAKISSGYSYQGNELLPSNTAMATIKNFNRTGGFNTNGFKEIKPKKNVKLEKYANLFDVLVAHTDITQNGDIIGNAEVVLDTVKYKKIIYSMDLVKVTPKNHLISPFLLALLLQGNELKKYCLRYVNGTTVLHLNKKAIKKFEIPIPNNISDINNIEKYARYTYKNMSINLKENRILKSLKTEILNKYF